MSHLNDQIVNLYDTIFNRAPDEGGLAFWNGATHRGLSMGDMADQFITAPEFSATYGQPTNLGFVQSMYQNVLGRPGEAEGVSFWTRVLNEGLADRGHIAYEFSQSPEHIAQMAIQYGPAPAPVEPAQPAEPVQPVPVEPAQPVEPPPPVVPPVEQPPVVVPPPVVEPPPVVPPVQPPAPPPHLGGNTVQDQPGWDVMLGTARPDIFHIRDGGVITGFVQGQDRIDVSDFHEEPLFWGGVNGMKLNIPNVSSYKQIAEAGDTSDGIPIRNTVVHAATLTGPDYWYTARIDIMGQALDLNAGDFIL